MTLCRNIISQHYLLFVFSYNTWSIPFDLARLDVFRLIHELCCISVSWKEIRGFGSAIGNCKKKRNQGEAKAQLHKATKYTTPSSIYCISKASYPLLRAAAPFCALFWVHHRSTARSTVPGLWPGEGFGTTPAEAGTLCTAPHSRWHRSHTRTGIYSWAWSSARYGRSRRHAHSLFPPYLAERNDKQPQIIETCKLQTLGSYFNVFAFITKKLRMKIFSQVKNRWHWGINYSVTLSDITQSKPPAS